MTGQIKLWRAFGLRRLALALLAAWVATQASLSGMYTTALFSNQPTSLQKGCV